MDTDTERRYPMGTPAERIEEGLRKLGDLRKGTRPGTYADRLIAAAMDVLEGRDAESIRSDPEWRSVNRRGVPRLEPTAHWLEEAGASMNPLAPGFAGCEPAGERLRGAARLLYDGAEIIPWR